MLNPERLPDCHRCGAPAIAEVRVSGVTEATFRHEHWCQVPDRPADRQHLARLVSDAMESA